MAAACDFTSYCARETAISTPMSILDLGEDLLAQVAERCASDADCFRLLLTSKVLRQQLSVVEVDLTRDVSGTSSVAPHTGIFQPAAAVRWLCAPLPFTLRGLKLRLEDPCAEEGHLQEALGMPSCSGLRRLTLQAGRAERKGGRWVTLGGGWTWKPSCHIAPLALQSCAAAPGLQALKLQGLHVSLPPTDASPSTMFPELTELELDGCMLLPDGYADGGCPPSARERCDASLAGLEGLGALRSLTLRSLFHATELGTAVLAPLA
eukprot:3420102-Prymnesium_polylepis.1